MGSEDKDKQPKRGAMFESVALTAAAVAFGFVTLADLLSHTVQATPPSVVAANSKFALPHPNTPLNGPGAGRAGIDYSSTGSIVSMRQTQHVDPCEMKN